MLFHYYLYYTSTGFFSTHKAKKVIFSADIAIAHAPNLTVDIAAGGLYNVERYTNI